MPILVKSAGISEVNDINPMLQNCKILLNWEVKSIKNLFYIISNVGYIFKNVNWIEKKKWNSLKKKIETNIITPKIFAKFEKFEMTKEYLKTKIYFEFAKK